MTLILDWLNMLKINNSVNLSGALPAGYTDDFLKMLLFIYFFKKGAVRQPRMSW